MIDVLSKAIESRASNVARQQSINIVQGIVTRSDSDNNIVDVKYMNMNGTLSNKVNVPVRIYFDDGVGSFPDVGDVVELQETFGSLIVTAFYEKEYRAKIRSKRELKSDLFSDSTSFVIGGVIF